MMSAELNIYGLYMPGLLLFAVLALILTRVLIRILAMVGIYRWVWHPALFDTCLYVIMLFCCSYASLGYFAPANWF